MVAEYPPSSQEVRIRVRDVPVGGAVPGQRGAYESVDSRETNAQPDRPACRLFGDRIVSSARRLIDKMTPDPTGHLRYTATLAASPGIAKRHGGDRRRVVVFIRGQRCSAADGTRPISGWLDRQGKSTAIRTRQSPTTISFARTYAHASRDSQSIRSVHDCR